MQEKINLLFLGLAVVPSMAQAKEHKPEKPNVLFIAFDDLKPILGCYGDSIIMTPNIDRVAKNGTVFLTNYCQQAVSGPTRASLMTGMRPDYTKVWDLKTPMRDVNPDILSLPQYFKGQGYSTQGIGKIYDPRNVDKNLDAPSWTVPFYNKGNSIKPKKNGSPSKASANSLTANKITTSCIDVPDNAYADGANALFAKDILIKLKQDKTPFFFAVGFLKPHLPFTAPKKYWDLYDREKMPIAEYQKKVKNGVDIAYHTASEIRMYTDIPPLLENTDQKDFGITLPLSKQKELIHGYHAAVSYVDAQLGIILNTLDSLGLTENTIIVLWGDHGWHLGDHNLWCKHTNFEQATRSPLIISAPGLKSGKTKSPTEFVDIFPTLCDLAGVPIPSHLDGKSLVPVMKNTSKKVKQFAVSQYPRSSVKQESERLGFAEGKYMGYSMRTERYRYTMWLKDDFCTNRVFHENLVFATELFDYQTDPNETINVVDEKLYVNVAKDLKIKMLNYFKAQRIKLNKK